LIQRKRGFVWKRSDENRFSEADFWVRTLSHVLFLLQIFCWLMRCEMEFEGKTCRKKGFAVLPKI
jgi:hypothetical protein